MERMWRKVNQGLSSTTSTVFKQSTSRSVDNGGEPPQKTRHHQHQLLEDDGPVYANVPQHNRGWGYIDTTKCRKRRRKVKGRRTRCVFCCCCSCCFYCCCCHVLLCSRTSSTMSAVHSASICRGEKTGQILDFHLCFAALSTRPCVTSLESPSPWRSDTG